MDFNFFSPKTTEKEIQAFFGPIEAQEVFIPLEPNWTFADIAVQCGIFKSKSEAKRNGWGNVIPTGFWHKNRIGRNNVSVTILKLED